MNGSVFRDRADAGRRLAEALRSRAFDRPVVLALPRGGLPVADEVARALGAELDVLLVRKIGHPEQPELALGAVGEGGILTLNEDLAGLVPRDRIDAIARRERAEIARRASVYRAVRPRADLRGRDAIIIDDGAATGATVRAAIAVARAAGAGRVTVALPVAPAQTVRDLGHEADGVVCLSAPESFGAVGLFYDEFGQVPDDEALAILRATAQRAGP
ncbi:MAG: phosphoribosyltransferase [Planctomycetota bacterium]|nr:MAG: phosphoribosyltransferase [Planctomycetota bacterium]